MSLTDVISIRMNIEEPLEEKELLSLLCEVGLLTSENDSVREQMMNAFKSSDGMIRFETIQGAMEEVYSLLEDRKWSLEEEKEEKKYRARIEDEKEWKKRNIENTSPNEHWIGKDKGSKRNVTSTDLRQLYSKYSGEEQKKKSKSCCDIL